MQEKEIIMKNIIKIIVLILGVIALPFYMLGMKSKDKLGRDTHKKIKTVNFSRLENRKSLYGVKFHEDGSLFTIVDNSEGYALVDIGKNGQKVLFEEEFTVFHGCSDFNGERKLRAMAETRHHKLTVENFKENSFHVLGSEEDKSISCIKLHPTENWIASGNNFGKVKVYDFKTKKIISSFEGHIRAVSCLDFHPALNGAVVSGSKDGSVIVWNSSSGTKLKAHKGAVVCVACHPTKKIVVSASEKKELVIWNLDSGEHIKINNLQHPICSLAFSKVSDQFVSGHYSGIVSLWELSGENYQILNKSFDGNSFFFKVLERHKNFVAFHPKKNLFVSVAYDGTIAVCELKCEQMGHALFRNIDYKDIRILHYGDDLFGEDSDSFIDPI